MEKKQIHANHRNRMRNKIKGDLSNFPDHEILEVLLYATFARKDTNELAHRLLQRFGSLKGVLSAERNELVSVDGVGEACADTIRVLKEFYFRINTDKATFKKINTSEKLVKFLFELFKLETKEKVYAICLDKSYNHICNILLNGIAEQSNAYIDMQSAINKICLSGAKHIVLTHNHLHDSVYPTQDDYNTTLMLTQRLLSLGIKVLDHIIINTNESAFFSFSENGFMDKIYTKLTSLPSGEVFKKLNLTSKIASGGVVLGENDFGIMF